MFGTVYCIVKRDDSLQTKDVYKKESKFNGNQILSLTRIASYKP